LADFAKNRARAMLGRKSSRALFSTELAGAGRIRLEIATAKKIQEANAAPIVYNAMPTPMPAHLLPAGATLADTVTSRLRGEILSGDLPPGAPVAEIPTAERLGVSRVPVREALLVLEQEGLLVFGPRGRARVRSLSPGDHIEIYHARLPLEKAAARLAAERRTEEDLSAMRANIAATRQARTLAKVSLLDLDFHDLVFRAARSPWLFRFWGLLRGELALWLTRLHREQQSVTGRVRETTSDSHEEYMALLRARSAAAAERHIETHMRYWLEWMPVEDETGDRTGGAATGPRRDGDKADSGKSVATIDAARQ
jgi:DNA-binding GntR family transcriptional regulator